MGGRGEPENILLEMGRKPISWNSLSSSEIIYSLVEKTSVPIGIRNIPQAHEGFRSLSKFISFNSSFEWVGGKQNGLPEPEVHRRADYFSQRP